MDSLNKKNWQEFCTKLLLFLFGVLTPKAGVWQEFGRSFGRRRQEFYFQFSCLKHRVKSSSAGAAGEADVFLPIQTMPLIFLFFFFYFFSFPNFWIIEIHLLHLLLLPTALQRHFLAGVLFSILLPKLQFSCLSHADAIFSPA